MDDDIENIMFNILFEYMLKQYHRVDVNRSAVDMLLNINTEKYVKSFVDVLIQTSITPHDLYENNYHTDAPPLTILHQLIANDNGKKMNELLKTIYGIYYNNPSYQSITVEDFGDHFHKQNISYETSMMYLTDIFLIALQHNTNVKTFTIFNENRQYGVEPILLDQISSSLANVLLHNKTLDTLDISWLNIDSISDIIFMFSSSEVRTLIMHSMFDINNADEDRDANFYNLIEALAGNTSLTSLNLADNWLGEVDGELDVELDRELDEGLDYNLNAQRIKDLINHNKMIIDLDVGDNEFSNEDVEEINRIILQNRALGKNLLFRLLENIVE